LAHQILADVEELFEDPFGPVLPDGVVAGHGGQLGFLMLKNHIGGPHELSQALQQVIDYVKNDVNSDWLELAGYQCDKETKTVRNTMNDRPFNATDAEHFLCKGWIDAKLTLGHYRNARRPQAAKPHCHPSDVECSWLKTIMEAIVLKYAKTCRGLDTPDFCILPGETLDCNAQ